MKEYQTEQQQASTSAQGNAARRDDNILHLSPRRDADGEPQLLSWQATLRGPASGAYDGAWAGRWIRRREWRAGV